MQNQQTKIDEFCRLAEKEIKIKWSVGEFSRFCDEPADFDAPEEGEIAAVIKAVYQKVLG